jgi:hypothetical protein
MKAKYFIWAGLVIGGAFVLFCIFAVNYGIP